MNKSSSPLSGWYLSSDQTHCEMFFFPHPLSHSKWRFKYVSLTQRTYGSVFFRCLLLKCQKSNNVHVMFWPLEAFTCSFGSRTKYLSTRPTDHTTLRWYYSPKNLACLRRWQKFAPTTCSYLTRLTWYKPIHQYLFRRVTYWHLIFFIPF